MWLRFRRYDISISRFIIQVESPFYHPPLRPIFRDSSDISELIICQRIEKSLDTFYNPSGNYTPFYSHLRICSSWDSSTMWIETALLNHRILLSSSFVSMSSYFLRFCCCRRFPIQSSANGKGLTTLLQSLKWNCVPSESLCFRYAHRIRAIGRQVDNCFCNDFLLSRAKWKMK